MRDSMKATLPGVGGVFAAAGSARCCAGPVVAVSLGVSGAGLSAFEPYRPYFLEPRRPSSSWDSGFSTERRRRHVFRVNRALILRS